MAVKIRLTRTGRKKLPSYRVVVADSQMPRDGRYIALVGSYDPKEKPARFTVARRVAASGATPSMALTWCTPVAVRQIRGSGISTPSLR